MKITKKYYAVDQMKECPFGAINSKQCHTCKLGIARYTEQEIAEEREKGNFEVENDSYSCLFIALHVELQKLNKKN